MARPTKKIRTKPELEVRLKFYSSTDRDVIARIKHEAAINERSLLQQIKFMVRRQIQSVS